MHRLLSALLLLTFTTTVGCSTWKPMPVTDAEITADEAKQLVGEWVRFYTDDGERTITVRQVEYPYVSGDSKLTGQIQIDLRSVHRIEVSSVSTSRTVFGVIVVAAVVGGLVALIVFSGTNRPFNHIR